MHVKCTCSDPKRLLSWWPQKLTVPWGVRGATRVKLGPRRRFQFLGTPSPHAFFLRASKLPYINSGIGRCSTTELHKMSGLRILVPVKRVIDYAVSQMPIQLWPLQVQLRATDARSCTFQPTGSPWPPPLTLELGYHDWRKPLNLIDQAPHQQSPDRCRNRRCQALSEPIWRALNRRGRPPSRAQGPH